MDDEGLSYFHQMLADSRCYLEFGCGGSTVYACNEAKVTNVLSVDTSIDWVKRIRAETATSGVNLVLDHVDLGEVGDWGKPKSADRYKDFWKYPASPWRKARELDLTPDTVLIDGRFRVACFLYSLLSAKSGTTIMFDDYFDRPHYFEVEKFCSLTKRVGRSGIFKSTNNFDVGEVVSAYARYSLDWS